MTLEETVVIAAGLKFSYWCKEVEKPPKKKTIINLILNSIVM